MPTNSAIIEKITTLVNKLRSKPVDINQVVLKESTYQLMTDDEKVQVKNDCLFKELGFDNLQLEFEKDDKLIFDYVSVFHNESDDMLQKNRIVYRINDEQKFMAYQAYRETAVIAAEYRKPECNTGVETENFVSAVSTLEQEYHSLIELEKQLQKI